MKVNEILIKNWGPIADFRKKMNAVNLIYGPNEMGKSFIVEFLIQSLFKNTGQWGELRKSGISGQGKVSINIQGSETAEFRPDSKSKLDTGKNAQDIFPQLSRLLIVREGDPRIIGENNLNSRSVILDRFFIKDIFSSKRVLETIIEDKNISPIIKNRTLIENGTINIHDMGEGKKYHEKQREYEILTDLIKRISENSEILDIQELGFTEKQVEKTLQELQKAKQYLAFQLSKDMEILNKRNLEYPENIIKSAEGNIAQLKNQEDLRDRLAIKINALDAQFPDYEEKAEEYDKQVRAKRYEAYKYYGQKQDLEKKYLKYDEIKISELGKKITEYTTLKSGYDKKQIETAKLAGSKEAFLWLKNAQKNYMDYLGKTLISSRYSQRLLILSIALIIAGFIAVIPESAFFQNILSHINLSFPENIFRIFFSSLFFLPGIILLFISLFKMKKKSSAKGESLEMENLKKDFYGRFHESLKNKTQLDVLSNKFEQEMNIYEKYRTDLENERGKMGFINDFIQTEFKKYYNDIPQTAAWEKYFHKIIEDSKTLKLAIDKIDKILDKWEVDESDFFREDPGVKYSREKTDELSEYIREYKIKINNKKDLENEKKICDEKISDLKAKTGMILKIENESNINTDNLSQMIWKIKNEFNKNIGLINNKEGELRELGVSPSEYSDEKTSIVYSRVLYEETMQKLSEIKESIKIKEQNINNFKNEICKETKDELTTDWNTLLDHLYMRKGEILQDICDYEAKIIGGKLVYETVSDMLQQEDKKIIEQMNSPDFKSYLNQLTDGRYNKIMIEDDTLIISGDYASYQLKDLSTGAKEQILLALRISFARKILGQEKGFFILDDAFQHSDYKKREILINTLFKIAEEGWQIIYLTMDDHIRKLFNDRASRDLLFSGKNYQEIVLE